MNGSRVFAVVPAAGRSRRMGTPKQLLEVGGQTMLTTVVAALARTRAAGIMIVTHSGLLPQLRRAQWFPRDEPMPAPRAGRKRSGDAQGSRFARREGEAPQEIPVLVALNDDERSEMIGSVRIGLATWCKRATIGQRDGFLVYPADQPGIDSADLDACIAAFELSPGKLIVATHGGRRGHPLVFPAALADFVASPACNGGLHALPAAHAARVVEVECHSRAAVRDVDTPADFQALS